MMRPGNEGPGVFLCRDAVDFRKGINGLAALVEAELEPQSACQSDRIGGVKASANLYSLIETAKVNGLEPYAYLRKVYTELPKAQSVADLEALLPHKATTL
jgi:hypothetical protein